MQHVWEKEEVHTGLWWGKPDGKRPLGRRRRRWEILLKLISKTWNGVIDWIDLAHDNDKCQALVR